MKVRSRKEKKKKEILQEHEDGDDNDDCINDDDDVTISNSGVEEENDDNESTKLEEQAQVCSNELIAIMDDTANFDGPYWANGTIGSKTEAYVLSVITTYNNNDGLHGLRSTPQYSFNRGMKEF